MAINLYSAVGGKSRLNRLVWSSMLGVLLTVTGFAATPAPQYLNGFDNSYNIPGSPPPTIFTTNFDNEALFSINFSTYNSSKPSQYYEPSYVLNYTNGENGVMTVNNPININQVLAVYNIGFNFDQGSTVNGIPAGSFYNQGTIRCNSLVDGNNLFTVGGFTFYDILGYGICNVSATNIVNPGNIIASVNGAITLNGQNVDLNRGVFNIESLQTTNGLIFGNTLLNALNLNSTGAVGLDTNADWNPGADLGPNSAISSFVPIPNYYLILTNSTSYFRTDGLATSNVIYRAVFVQNDSPNAPYNVYIDPPNQTYPGLNPGAAHVEWVGSYIDPATGLSSSNYLYLTDDYALGATTNAGLTLLPVNAGTGVPANFSFVTSPLPLFANPTPAGFLNIFTAGNITNFYSYMNGQIIPSTVSTNVTLTNPHGTIPNLPSKIIISGSQRLNLQNAIISGENYLALTATNQFDGSAGAQIAAPFSDINLAVTNGNLVFTNVLESDIPNWGGTIQAWSTRWTNTDTVTGISYDYRVLLVYSKLQPTTVPFVNNLRLSAGTNLFISDVLNVYGTFFTDAQRMTVTTNGVGVGATSAEGQLNTIFPGNLGLTQWPNLRWVTNNGTIGAQGAVSFTNVNNFGAVINNGVIADAGTTVLATNFVNSGTISNGTGNLNVQCQTATLTNSYVYAGGGITLVGKSLLASNVWFQSLSLSLNPSNSLGDGVPIPGNYIPYGEITNYGDNTWVVGRPNGTGGSGFSLLSNPHNGDFLGTTISNTVPPANKLAANIWAAQDYGAINRGFSNNAAVGRLIIDVQGNNSLVTFNGAGNAIGNSNALYVDYLEFRDTATNGIQDSYDFTNWVALNTNITIYFGQAFINGISVAEKINIASLYNGKNGGKVSTNGTVLLPGRLRWVPTYAGYFSSTNLVVDGVTNTVNAALAQSQDIDSNGNGVANGFDQSPFFTAQQINFSLSLTNHPVRTALLTWDTVPFATNSVFYATNLVNVNWLLYSNFTSTNVAGPTYPVTISDTNVAKGIRFYKVVVSPWLTYPY